MPPKTLLLIILLFNCHLSLAAPSLDTASGGEASAEQRAVDGYQNIVDLFTALGYTREAWLDGDRQVPRIYLADIPQRWSAKTSKQITVSLKKALFFRLLGPLVLRSNELIQCDRDKLLALHKSEPLTQPQRQWLVQLAERYRISDPQENLKTTIDRLIKRVDTLPPSLILAQAAEESGWGTSRFAFVGNALFGQWTWSGDGITPNQQRSGKGDYKIAAFDSPLQSVQAHALNLNTHDAYREFRTLRAKYRARGDNLDGMAAAETLTRYSERGADYVKTLHSIISYNKLQEADKAQLSPGHALVLVPVEP